MKKALCVLICVVIAMFLPSCRATFVSYDEFTQKPFTASIDGVYNGQSISLDVTSTDEGFFAKITNGALCNAIISLKNGNATVSLGTVADIPLSKSENGLVTLARLLTPDEIISQKSFSENGTKLVKISARIDGLFYTIIATQGAIPLELHGDNFDLNVKVK